MPYKAGFGALWAVLKGRHQTDPFMPCHGRAIELFYVYDNRLHNSAFRILPETPRRASMIAPVYISNGGEALGPYEMSQLRSMWSTGQITANTLYWN